MKFADLRLSEPILRAVASEGYSLATPIQALTIPHVLEGRDVLGSAQTGTGKTAAFALPVLDRLAQTPRAKAPKTGKIRARCLVLCPTRELAGQINDSFGAYGQNLSIATAVIFGGVNQNSQVKALRGGVDVIVATPGRLQDLMGQGHVDLRGVETLILDEADRMLDMGFIHDIKRIVKELPPKPQTLLFSATMPAEMRKLANNLLTNPATVEVAPETATVDSVDQTVYFVPRKGKTNLLAHLIKTRGISRAIVFTRTKHRADRVTKQLRARDLQAEAIHGNKTQNARQRALKNFMLGDTHVLVATDIAARGIDVDGVSHVINYDLTHEPETYVHRIGRTARAGASGHAVSFCDDDERAHLNAIQRFIRMDIPVRTDCPISTAPGPKPENREKRQRPTIGGKRPGRRPANTTEAGEAATGTTDGTTKTGGQRKRKPATRNGKPGVRTSKPAKRQTGGPPRRRRRSGGGGGGGGRSAK